ncbi:MAG: hypothetical protein U5K72_17645 [Balneolaceae bacterium]|nr:hypothetical protein [Balneolaceae bacterium]
MNIEQLKHAIRAACNVANDNEMIVFGSQAILGMFPEADSRLRRSIEVDMVPKNKPGNVDKIDGALGEMSAFHKTHGFYVHGVSVESAKLPPGWDKGIFRSEIGYRISEIAYQKEKSWCGRRDFFLVEMSLKMVLCKKTDIRLEIFDFRYAKGGTDQKLHIAYLHKFHFFFTPLPDVPIRAVLH